MTDEKPEKAKRSRRLYIYWGAALALLLTAGLFCWLVVAPVWQVHRALGRCESEYAGTGWATVTAEEIDGLGGPAAAAEKLGLCTRIPGFLAPGRLITVEVLAECGCEAVPELLRLLDSDEWVLRWSAALSFRKIRDSRSVEPLIARLKDEHGHVRVAAATGLAFQEDLRAVEPLIQALDDKKARDAAAKALGVLRDARAIRPLIAVLGDRDLEVWHATTHALSQIGKPAVPPLMSALGDRDARVRYGAAVVLGKICDYRAIPELERIATSDKETLVRRTAADALKKIKAAQEKKE